jgi:hypothetical protein
MLENRAWYLEQVRVCTATGGASADIHCCQGYFSKFDVKIIRDTYKKLCGEASTQALGIIEAFGIPRACLPAPIATGVYARL